MKDGHRDASATLEPSPHIWWFKYYSGYSIVLFLAAWEGASRFHIINPYFFPAPSLILLQAYTLALHGDLASHAFSTAWRSIAAILLSVAVGVPLGVSMARIPVVRWFFDPLVSIGFPTPKVALWPIFILWFGFYDVSKILLTATACVFVVISTTYMATRNVDKYLLWSALNMGTSRYRLLWRVVLRAGLPEILTGVESVAPIAFVVMVLTEMLSGGLGLGSMVVLAGRVADIQTVLVGVIVASVLGFAVVKALEGIRRHLLAWHEESTSPSRGG